MALGGGLQIHLSRFDSGLDLVKKLAAAILTSLLFVSGCAASKTEGYKALETSWENSTSSEQLQYCLSFLIFTTHDTFSKSLVTKFNAIGVELTEQDVDDFLDEKCAELTDGE